MTENLEYDRAKLAELCRKWRIKKLWFFGSVVRNDFRPDSDIDLLYEFEEGAKIGWDIVDVIEDFEQFFGRDVDFVAEKYLNRWIASRVRREAKLQYAA
jgi:predicted nucleotidyltransferase